MEDDYGVPEQGTSHELYNLILPLQKLYPGTTNFDYMRRMRAVGKRAMNRELLDLVEATRPDVTLVNLYTDQLLPETIRALRSWTTTVAYFFDDIWQRSFCLFWARHFDFVTTPDPGGVARFAADGVRTAIYSPFGFNEEIYVRQPLAKTHEVSFVGLYHPYRDWILDRVRRAGYGVAVFGHRWPAGRIPVESMVGVFNSTKINLNLSNSTHWDPRFLLARPIAVAWMLKLGKHTEQVKARHFELAGCGAFQLSYEVRWLGEYFQPHKQIATYRDVDDLLAKIGYYLDHDEEREAIADAAWRRARAEHTATRRLRELIETALARAPARPSFTSAPV